MPQPVSLTARYLSFTLRLSPYALLAFLPFVFFWRLYAPNPLDRMWLPDGDLTLQYFPLRIYAASEIAAGRLPLWNSAMYAGQPGLADSQMAALYPINLLTDILLGLLHAPFTFGVFQFQVVLHYSLAAIFTYAFALRITRKQSAAWVAALIFVFGGYLISYPAEQNSILESAVWLPLVLLCLDWAAAQTVVLRRMVGLALAGGAMALSILAGHPQTYLYVLYASIAYALYVVHKAHTAAGGPPAAITAQRSALSASPFASRIMSYGLRLVVYSAPIGVFLFFAFGLSAAQLLPTLEFTRYSTRAQLGYAFTSGGFALHELITLLIPGYFGGMPLYVGIISLLLVAIAISGTLRSHGMSQTTLFWLLLALVAIFLSFGDSSFLYPLFYLLVPGFSQVRDQERIVLLWAFALAMLAAIGAAQFALPLSRRMRSAVGPAFTGVLGTLLLALTLFIALAYLAAQVSTGDQPNLFPGILRQLVPAFFWLVAAWALWHLRVYTAAPRRWLLLGGVLLIGLNLFSVNSRYNFQKPTPPDYFPATDLTHVLQAELRANPLARVASEGLLPGAHNAGTEYGFADINGNDPLHLDAYEQFDRSVQELRRFQLLGVQVVITKRTIEHGAFTLLATAGDVHLYRFSGALPRAWMVNASGLLPVDKQSAALSDPAFDPASVVLLALNAHYPLILSGGDATVTRYAPGHLSVQTRSDSTGMLVISEVFYPGWRVTIDGNSTELYQADGVLMAVALPAGAHTVELTFAPNGFTIGAVISGLSVAAWLALLVRARFR